MKITLPDWDFSNNEGTFITNFEFDKDTGQLTLGVNPSNGANAERTVNLLLDFWEMPPMDTWIMVGNNMPTLRTLLKYMPNTYNTGYGFLNIIDNGIETDDGYMESFDPADWECWWMLPNE